MALTDSKLKTVTKNNPYSHFFRHPPREFIENKNLELIIGEGNEIVYLNRVQRSS